VRVLRFSVSLFGWLFSLCWHNAVVLPLSLRSVRSFVRSFVRSLVSVRFLSVVQNSGRSVALFVGCFFGFVGWLAGGVRWWRGRVGLFDRSLAVDGTLAQRCSQ